MRAAVLGVATAGLVAIFPGRVSGQSTARGTIEVSARIMQTLSVRGVNNLNFGDIVASSSSTTQVVNRTDPNAGMFELTGSTGQGVQVSFVAPTALVRTGGPGSMPIALTLHGATTQAGSAGAQEVLQGGSVVLTNGRYYLFVAGRLTVRDVATNPAGIYTGEFEIAVSYTTI